MAGFYLMAQLAREPNGLRLSELSKRMMVTNGNLTALVDRLIEERYVCRGDDPSDGRASVVRLTKASAAIFKKIAAAEAWLLALFDGLSHEAVLKSSVVEADNSYHRNQ